MKARGQSTAEYAIVIAVVAGALLAMSVYMKGGLSGRLRTATEQIGDQFVPDAYKAKFRITETSSGREEMQAGAAPAKGQSHTDREDNTPATIEEYDGIKSGIHTIRKSEEAEQTTDDLATDSLF